MRLTILLQPSSEPIVTLFYFLAERWKTQFPDSTSSDWINRVFS